MVAEGRSWSYSALLRDVERVAGSFQALGYRRSDRLAVFADNHPATVITWLAGAMTGIPVSIVNSRWTASELGFVLRQLAPRAVFADAAHVAVVSDAAATLDRPPGLFSIGDTPIDGMSTWASLLEGGQAAAGEPLSDDVVEITYTSGTTSTPKGAVFTNRELMFLIESWNGFIGYGESEVAYGVVPLFHGSGLRYSVLAPLVAGSSVVIAPFSARRFWKDIGAYGCTYFFGPEGIPLILETLPPTPLERTHHVKHLLGGGKPEFADRIEDRFGLVVLNTYGMTEFGPACSPPPDEPTAERRRRRHYIPGAMYIGRPIHPEIKVRVVGDDGVDLPAESIGEIWVSSPGMFREYLSEPNATALAVGDGWMRTGDLGLVSSEGCYYFLDRKKDVIRRGGENIASSEVEDWIASHPAVRGIAVFPVPDDLRVQEVKAIVELKPGHALTAPELWEWCQRKLADFKIPRYVEFRPELPRNATGRALKQQLRQEPLDGQGETWDRTTGQPVNVHTGGQR